VDPKVLNMTVAIQYLLIVYTVLQNVSDLQNTLKYREVFTAFRYKLIHSVMKCYTKMRLRSLY